MKLIRNLGVGFGLLTSRRDLRVSADEIDVFYSSDSEQKAARVKDISPTGIFILTRDCLALGGRIPLTLKKSTLRDKSSQPSLRLFAKTVRYGKDGVGLTFLYGDVDTAAWSKLMEQASPLIKQGDFIGMVRVSAALAYLSRICRANAAESLKLILDEMVYENGEKALDILIDAEEMVSRRGHSARADVSPRIVNRILSNGAMIDVKWMRSFWAGLLAAASLEGASDEKSLEYISLLSQLDSVQLRIFATACTRCTQFRDESGEIAAQKLACKAEQLQLITRVPDRTHIERALDRLYQVGLVEMTVKADPFSLLEVANLTPTRAGLTFYAKCRGLMQPADPSALKDQMPLFDAEESFDQAAMSASQARLSFA